MNTMFNAAIPSLLVLLFIVLKINDVTDMPWLAVFAPYFIYIALVTVYIAGVVLCVKKRK